MHVWSRSLSSCFDLQNTFKNYQTIVIQMPPKKNLKTMQGQTKLTFFQLATSLSKQVVPDDVLEIKEVQQDVTQTKNEKPSKSKTTKECKFLEDRKKNYS